MILSMPLLLMTSSCDADYLITAEPQLVVEGWIDDGEFPVVLLTYSIPLSEEPNDLSDWKSLLVRYAVVKVSDGDTEVTLTGKYDSRYMPPYVYTTGRLRGQAGKTYHLTVDYDDLHAEAVTEIPMPPKSVEYSVAPVSSDSSLYKITATFDEDTTTTDYYNLRCLANGESRQYMACYMGTAADNVMTGRQNLPVYRPHKLGLRDYTPYFEYLDTVDVKFSRIGYQEYLFWDSYLKSLSTASDMFMSTGANIVGNVSGAYGYWCGYGSITSRVIVK